MSDFGEGLRDLAARIGADPRVPWPADLTELFWWRPGFGRWRRGPHHGEAL
ncbi:hypothetical protein [Nocardiopsis sp. CC223A]|uniref:hypothetical protein n=1 Tax=Nocardiopsis sp. CC223A TaxID=3044051 RepID=UPI00279576BA|nr:hypothetical protein [Nocardiopsis sp. CC223A]